MGHTKTDTTYLNSPPQDLSNSGLGFAVALLFFRELSFRVRVAHSQSSCSELLLCPEQ